MRKLKDQQKSDRNSAPSGASRRKPEAAMQDTLPTTPTGSPDRERKRKTKASLYLDAEIYEEFRALMWEVRRPMGEMVTDAMREYLHHRPKGNPQRRR